MTTMIKIAAAITLTLMMLSCQMVSNIGPGVRGNGNVQTEVRQAASFNKIEVSNGLDLFLTQGTEESISIQADENLLEVIKTEVNGGILRIFAEENIRNAASRKVMVTFKNLDALTASSGSDALSNTQISVQDIRIKSSSGADIDLEITAQNIVASSSSGSDIYLKGSANSISADASSGSSIKAGELKVTDGTADASSGADVVIQVKGQLIASASSGGDVTYIGKPEHVDANKSSGGRVRSKN